MSEISNHANDCFRVLHQTEDSIGQKRKPPAHKLRVNYYILYQPPGLPDLTSKDPRWIENWWVGFLGSAGFLSLFSVILLGFPTHL